MQIDELKQSMTKQRDALYDVLSKAEAAVNAAAENAAEDVKAKLAEARSALSTARDHLSAYADTAHVAADAQPGRVGGAAVGGEYADPVKAAFVGGAPVGLSGVPVTPPGDGFASAGPAVPHVDVGQRDVNGATADAPAAVAPDAEPVLDPQPVYPEGEKREDGAEAEAERKDEDTRKPY